MGRTGERDGLGGSTLLTYTNRVRTLYGHLTAWKKQVINRENVGRRFMQASPLCWSELFASNLLRTVPYHSPHYLPYLTYLTYLT